MSIDMADFRPIPNHPAYLLHRDGRVLSLKKSPAAVLSENPGRSLVWRRVRFGGQDWRVRDLVALIYGDITALDERTRDEYDELGLPEDYPEVAW